MRILIVDDSVAMRRLEKNMLSGWDGAEVVEACDGLQALQMVAGDKIDLILMDWKMPVLSGIETLRQLKATPEISSIPVIMITSESQKPKIVEAIGAGASNYLLKPFTEEQLREKVKPFLVQQSV